MAALPKNIQPKADQPRVATESLNRADKSPALQYKISSGRNSVRVPRKGSRTLDRR